MQWYLVLGWLLTLADAQEDSDESSESSDAPSTEEADDEIIVYGQREVDRRRSILDNQLESTGYRQGKRRGDKVVYRPETVWHPSVIVYDSGWVDIRKTPPRFEPWIGGHPDNKWRYLSCIPPFGLMCIRASGWLISTRRAQHSKTAVVENNIETIQYWQESVQGLATQNRMDVELPNQLDAIWTNPDVSQEERIAEILELWASRTCTPEGNMAAAVIGDFLVYEVYPESPLSDGNRTFLVEHNHCDRPIPE
jgi:hypothetical protein